MKKKAINAVFNFEKSDEKLIDGLISYLDENAQRIYDFFEIGDKFKKPIINIVGTKKELDSIFRKIHGFDVDEDIPRWIIGFSASDLEIYLLSLNDYKSTSHAFKEDEYNDKLEYYKKTLLHEFVHHINRYFCINNNCEYSLQYLSEGVAKYLCNQTENIKLEYKYSLDDILNSNKCYDGWYLTTKYIIDNYSHEFLIDLLKNNNKAEKFLKEIYDDIKNYYNNL